MFFSLIGCNPPQVAVDVHPSEHVPAVLVARVDGAGGVVELRVEHAAGERVFEATGEVALVGVPAGEPFRIVPVVDGVDGDAIDAEAPPVPEGWPAFTQVEGELVPDTAFLVSLIDDQHSGLGIVDGVGRWRWWWLAPADRTVASPRLSADGTAVVFTSMDRAREGIDQYVDILALDGSGLREVALEGAHHMVEALDDGSFAWLAWDTRTTPWIDGEPQSVTADRVLVDGEERFSFFDDLGPASVPCNHGTVLVERRGEPTYEWSHANSLVWEPETDLLLAGSRLLDTIVALDRATGDVAWILGGDAATLTLDDPFSHAHFSDVAANRVLVFDNGVHHDPPASRILEIEIDPEQGLATITREVPLRAFHRRLGDARWRGDGSLLVAAAQPGILGIVDAAGRDVWRLDLDDAAVLGRVRELEGFLR